MITELEREDPALAAELPRIARRILNTPLLIAPGAAAALVSGLAGRLGVLPLRAATPLTAIDRGSQGDGEAPYAVADGVATISLLGETVNRGSWVSAQSQVTSYEAIQRALRQAEADPTVAGILLDIDSPGGEAAGAMETAAVVRAVAAMKPVVAYVNWLAASAAYAIAAGALEIVAAPSATLGSIGVVYLHVDRSRAMAAVGLKPTLIFAGARKIDGNSLRPLDDAARGAVQQQIDDVYALLVGSIGRHRSRLGEGGARRTEAAIYFGQKAVDAGLADRIGAMSDALQTLRSGWQAPTARADAVAAPAARAPTQSLAATTIKAIVSSERSSELGLPANLPEVSQTATDMRARALEAGFAEGVPAAFTRAQAILKCEAVKGREELAVDLVLHTDLPAEQAIAVLAKTPKQETRWRGPAERRETRKHVFYSTAEFDEAKRRGEIRSGDEVVFTTRH